jgi:hypothetical protein
LMRPEPAGPGSKFLAEMLKKLDPVSRAMACVNSVLPANSSFFCYSFL